MNTTQKILIFDLETSPNISYTWGKYEQDVVEFLEETHLLSFAYKWHGSKQTRVWALPDCNLYKKDKNNDRELVKVLHELFEEADVLVAHNGASFDVKMANRFFIKNKLTPISEYKVVDTKLLAKSKFRFGSNKLDDLGNYLGLGRKVKTGGFDLWKGCMSGDMKSWNLMKKYNKQDVILLEKIYDLLVPWCKHPIVYIDTNCKVCGSKHLQQRGWSYQDSGKSKRKKFSCNDCHRWSLGKLEKI